MNRYQHLEVRKSNNDMRALEREVGERGVLMFPVKEDQVVTETAKRERHAGTSEGTMVPRDGLVAGLRLVARYKGQTYHAEVVEERGRVGVRIVGTIIVHDSLSSAGKGVTGGSVNGWKFWTVDHEEPAINFPAPKRKPGRPRKVAAPVVEAPVEEKPLSEGGPFNHELYGWN